MKTVFAKPGSVRGDWFVGDASDKTLGRLASQIAHRLKGKHKADYSPHVEMGDHIVVLHAGKIAVTGNKLDDKMYHHHTGYLGNLKSIALGKLLKEHPERALQFVEITAPARLYGIGVFQIAIVQRFDEWRIGAEQVRTAEHFLVHGA